MWKIDVANCTVHHVRTYMQPLRQKASIASVTPLAGVVVDSPLLAILSHITAISNPSHPPSSGGKSPSAAHVVLPASRVPPPSPGCFQHNSRPGFFQHNSQEFPTERYLDAKCPQTPSVPYCSERAKYARVGGTRISESKGSRVVIFYGVVL